MKLHWKTSLYINLFCVLWLETFYLFYIILRLLKIIIKRIHLKNADILAKFITQSYWCIHGRQQPRKCVCDAIFFCFGFVRKIKEYLWWLNFSNFMSSNYYWKLPNDVRRLGQTSRGQSTFSSTSICVQTLSSCNKRRRRLSECCELLSRTFRDERTNERTYERAYCPPSYHRSTFLYFFIDQN